jgi:biotin carboxyl carrier protein
MDQEIKAPMPGTIVDILVQVGDQVEAEQDLVVLESMKMENVISSRSGGRVTAIEVEVGQNVTANKVLARVAAAGGIAGAAPCRRRPTPGVATHPDSADAGP